MEEGSAEAMAFAAFLQAAQSVSHMFIPEPDITITDMVRAGGSKNFDVSYTTADGQSLMKPISIEWFMDTINTHAEQYVREIHDLMLADESGECVKV